MFTYYQQCLHVYMCLHVTNLRKVSVFENDWKLTWFFVFSMICGSSSMMFSRKIQWLTCFLIRKLHDSWIILENFERDLWQWWRQKQNIFLLTNPQLKLANLNTVQGKYKRPGKILLCCVNNEILTILALFKSCGLQILESGQDLKARYTFCLD